MFNLQKFTVSYEYPVHFTSDVLKLSNPTLAQAIARIELKKRHRLLAVIDEGVAKGWPRICQDFQVYAEAFQSNLELVAPPEIVEGGENAKNKPTYPSGIQKRICELELDRHSVIVAIGGGAVLDMVGYAVGTTHRGMRIVRLPTTVLSQADGGVGVKNGINAFGNKNFLGTFAPPFAVINDIRFLETLDARDQIAGMAEAVKVALIRDPDFFNWLLTYATKLSELHTPTISAMIQRCAELHLDHIAHSGDPFEFGYARPLDFGHWAAHKLETMADYQLRHGEAVAIGLALDTRYSFETGLLDEQSLDTICGLLKQLGLHIWDPILDLTDSTGQPQILQGLEEFRQHIGGPITLILLEKIGYAVEIDRVDTEAMIRAINWLRSQESFR